ncbi:tail-anchored protein insertion receptor WRB-like [Arapaima gigas]
MCCGDPVTILPSTKWIDPLERVVPFPSGVSGGVGITCCLWCATKWELPFYGRSLEENCCFNSGETAKLFCTAEQLKPIVLVLFFIGMGNLYFVLVIKYLLLCLFLLIIFFFCYCV